MLYALILTLSTSCKRKARFKIAWILAVHLLAECLDLLILQVLLVGHLFIDNALRR